jgi:hypothetical protein
MRARGVLATQTKQVKVSNVPEDANRFASYDTE